MIPPSACVSAVALTRLFEHLDSCGRSATDRRCEALLEKYEEPQTN